MNRSVKEAYETPSATVVTVAMERFICQSGVPSSRRSYGTASTTDDTEQEWN